MSDEQAAHGPNYRMPTKQENYQDDPYADERNYFAYYEARRLEQRRRAQRDKSCLNIYERARLRDEDDY